MFSIKNLGRIPGRAGKTALRGNPNGPRSPQKPPLVALALFLSAAAVCEAGSTRETSQDRFVEELVEAAIARTAVPVVYDGSYRNIPYPGGDVPNHIGVCTDLVIRAYRAVGVDLQMLVHEDMAAAFREYPPIWGLSRPDPNIDHRRVPNLQTFFRRRGAELPASTAVDTYLPGDLVTWMLPGNLPHIGVITGERSPDGNHPMVAHNIGGGPVLEDLLFEYPITGHYRYRGESADLR